MNLVTFIKDKSLLLLLHAVCMVLMSSFLYLTNYGIDYIWLIMIVWGLILAVFLIVSYYERKTYFNKIKCVMENIDRLYLLGEMLPKSFKLEDCIYQEIIHRSNKSVIEKIKQIEEQQREYREYIESWVHEVKAPITGIASICENRSKGDSFRGYTKEVIKEAFTDIFQENQKIENYVDMVLYYARSENVYKDYIIVKTNLVDAVYEALAKNRRLFIQNQACVEVDCTDLAYTDKKWLVFILNQLFLNSIKYRNGNLLVKVYTKAEKDSVFLVVQDNGLGISKEDLPRIFDKGFTGNNGRCIEVSTGMGLYLCHKLCDKLGIKISAKSEFGMGTSIILEFPIGNFMIMN